MALPPAEPRTDENSPDIWRCVFDPENAPMEGDPGALSGAATRFAALVSPVLAEYLLAPYSRRAGWALVPGDAAAESRLIARFNLSQHRRWGAELVGAGFDLVFMKGFANAHTLYTDPVLRMQGDLDILARADDLPRIVAFLSERNFSFRPLPVKPWGMISDASYFPFVSNDGGCDIDLHIHPDCYPAHRSMTTEDVFDGAAHVEIEGMRFAIPGREHAFLLCVTNAAKDKFGVFSLRKIIDAAIMLRGDQPPDLDRVASIAEAGGFLGPANVFCRLLAALGVPPAGFPDRLTVPLSGFRRRDFDDVLSDFRGLFPREPGLGRLLWREWMLCAEPAVALHNFGLRLRGLVRGAPGVPPGAPVDKGFH